MKLYTSIRLGGRGETASSVQVRRTNAATVAARPAGIKEGVFDISSQTMQNLLTLQITCAAFFSH